GNNSALSKGLRELYDLGIIDKIPRIAIIQASGANPLYKMWINNAPYERVRNADTIATAIKIGNPVSWKKAMRGVAWSNGVVDQVTDQEIMDAKAWVDGAGIGAEPASCATVAGAKKLVEKGVIDPDAKVVGILTGHLLKDPDATVFYHKSELSDRGIASHFANAPLQIEPTLDAVRQHISSLIQ
ncbi:pyridoxal-phosphate dependent enzyme, partial [Candidatus Sumerlaeota bacterium]|nr:pyridoxal-phosphate dependent enzyme [Candidatus Sumerlaeota bacterium]